MIVACMGDDHLGMDLLVVPRVSTFGSSDPERNQLMPMNGHWNECYTISRKYMCVPSDMEVDRALAITYCHFHFR